MKILYFYQYFSTPKGSWGTRVYEFASEWVKKGHEVVVVTSIYSKSDLKASKFIENQKHDGIDVKVINIGIDNKQSFLKRIWTFALYAVVSCYYALTIKCDLIIASSGPISVGLPGLFGRHIRRKKLVFEVRDLWPEGAIELGVIKNKLFIKMALAFEKLCYKSSSLIIGLSPGIKDWISEKHGHKNIVDVTNAANIELFSKEHDSSGIDPNLGTYAIYTGNIGLVNNCGWLLNTAEELMKLGREDIKIVLIGDGQIKDELVAKAKSDGISNFIVMDLMPKERLVAYVQQSLASLVPLANTPILNTSSPNKFYESLAAGVPVIQNTDGWLMRFVEEHNVGYNVEPDNSENLANVLIELDKIHGTPEYDDLKARCMEVAKANFDKKYLAQKMLDELIAIK